MSDAKNENGSGAGAVAGFQAPLGIRKRKKKVDEALAAHPDLGHGAVLAYVVSLDESSVPLAESMLDEGRLDDFATAVREHAVREMIRKKLPEVVRKKKGGGGYVLYSPNKGKQHPSRAVGTFPTKLGAKRAELARFPPKDGGKLKRLRRDVDKMLKDPKARQDAEKTAGAEPKKHESLDVLRRTLVSLVRESLYREEHTGSDWDDRVKRLPSAALATDKKLQRLQKGIEKRSEQTLRDAFGYVQKSVDRKVVKLKELGVRSAPDKGKTYLAFQATVGQAAVGPIAIYIEGGVPKIELSDEAKAGLTKADPKDARLFRADIVQVQERVLDRMDELEKAVQARDRYLESSEDELDSYVAELSPLQVLLLKQLLTSKYRKLG